MESEEPWSWAAVFTAGSPKSPPNPPFSSSSSFGPPRFFYSPSLVFNGIASRLSPPGSTRNKHSWHLFSPVETRRLAEV